MFIFVGQNRKLDYTKKNFKIPAYRAFLLPADKNRYRIQILQVKKKKKTE